MAQGGALVRDQHGQGGLRLGQGTMTRIWTAAVAAALLGVSQRLQPLRQEPHHPMVGVKGVAQPALQMRRQDRGLSAEQWDEFEDEPIAQRSR